MGVLNSSLLSLDNYMQILRLLLATGPSSWPQTLELQSVGGAVFKYIEVISFWGFLKFAMVNFAGFFLWLLQPSEGQDPERFTLTFKTLHSYQKSLASKASLLIGAA